jgi:hypothetical protein
MYIHDPASPGPVKKDVYEVKGTRVVNYKYAGTTTAYIKYAYAESVVDAPPPPKSTRTPVPTPKEKPYRIIPREYAFKHNIGETECPTYVGGIELDGAPGFNWKIISPTPMWMTVSKKSGTFPDSFNVNFSCNLTSYITQTLQDSIDILISDPDGIKVDNVEIDISGQINE